MRDRDLQQAKTAQQQARQQQQRDAAPAGFAGLRNCKPAIRPMPPTAALSAPRPGRRATCRKRGHQDQRDQPCRNRSPCARNPARGLPGIAVRRGGRPAIGQIAKDRGDTIMRRLPPSDQVQQSPTVGGAGLVGLGKDKARNREGVASVPASMRAPLWVVSSTAMSAGSSRSRSTGSTARSSRNRRSASQPSWAQRLRRGQMQRHPSGSSAGLGRHGCDEMRKPVAGRVAQHVVPPDRRRRARPRCGAVRPEG